VGLDREKKTVHQKREKGDHAASIGQKGKKKKVFGGVTVWGLKKRGGGGGFLTQGWGGIGNKGEEGEWTQLKERPRIYFGKWPEEKHQGGGGAAVVWKEGDVADILKRGEDEEGFQKGGEKGRHIWVGKKGWRT